MYYVCEYSDGRPLQFLAGPYATEDDAVVAAGAYEAEHPEFQTRTFVWTCLAGRDESSKRFDASANQPVPPLSSLKVNSGTIGLGSWPVIR